MSRHPEVLWAQRSDRINLTISLPDAKDVVVNTEPQGVFRFSATGPQGDAFGFELQLFGSILPDGGKINIGRRNIICSIKKENKGWWMRLLKSDKKPAPYIKVDWNNWCDEDEEEYESLAYGDDGEGEDGDESSDDDGLLYLPDLEKIRGK